ncbi:hypothetical protein [Caulobacter sp.]|uniref:hypothetical protein n=1 Tax=Caulobacter sp. TaxID=78 RepID=UPI003BAB4396
MKTSIETVEWMIDVVKTALEEGSASASDLEDWLLAVVTLEELALEEAADTRQALNFSSWILPAGTLH